MNKFIIQDNNGELFKLSSEPENNIFQGVWTTQKDPHEKLNKQELTDYMVNTSESNYNWFKNNRMGSELDYEKIDEMRMIKGIIE